LSLKKLSVEFKTDCDDFLSRHWLHSKADKEVFTKLMCRPDEVILGKDGHTKVSFEACWSSMNEAWAAHTETYGNMSTDQIRDILLKDNADTIDPKELFEEEHVAPEELKMIDLTFKENVSAKEVAEMNAHDRQVFEHRMVENVTSVYAVLIKAIDNALRTEQHKHLISHKCLGSLEFSIGVAKDVLARTDMSDPNNCPLCEFFYSVELEIEEGMTGFQDSLFAHQRLEHLLLSTEMLYGVIMIFSDLQEVGSHIAMPGWDENAKRIQENVDYVIGAAYNTLRKMYREHPRLMVTVHTILAARHGFHLLGSKIHVYGEAGLLSEEFDKQAKEAFTIRLREVHEFFDTSFLRRVATPVLHCTGVLPVVDRSIYKDEPTGFRCKALARFLNPFTSSRSLERRRHKQALRQQQEAEAEAAQGTQEEAPKNFTNPLQDLDREISPER
jgi:hypothetical protein